MASQIEDIAEYEDGDKVWRTTCKCMGDDDLTFTVATDDEFPEVYLEVYMDCSTYYKVWNKPAWSRPFRSFWRRIVGSLTLLFKGYVKVNGAFIFRGPQHIDEFTDTIQSHKNYLISKHKEIVENDVNILGRESTKKEDK